MSKEWVVLNFFNSICPKPFVLAGTQPQDQISGCWTKVSLIRDVESGFPVDDLHKQTILQLIHTYNMLFNGQKINSSSVN